MKFQRARNQKQIDQRKKEITAACKQIYIAEGYDSITMEKISQFTSMSRSSIYNYYTTKEEIILELLAECCLEFEDILKKIFDSRNNMTKEEFCELFATELNKQSLFLSLNTVHFITLTLDKNCSQEMLDEFKIKIKPLFDTIHNGVKKFFPNVSDEQKHEFIFFIFAMVNGIYPMTHLTEKQHKALAKAIPDYKTPDFYKIFKKGMLALMHGF